MLIYVHCHLKIISVCVQDISEHLKEFSATEDAKCRPPSTKDANDKGPLKDGGAGDQEERDPSIVHRYLLDVNKDDKNGDISNNSY